MMGEIARKLKTDKADLTIMNDATPSLK